MILSIHQPSVLKRVTLEQEKDFYLDYAARQEPRTDSWMSVAINVTAALNQQQLEASALTRQPT